MAKRQCYTLGMKSDSDDRNEEGTISLTMKMVEFVKKFNGGVGRRRVSAE